MDSPLVSIVLPVAGLAVGVAGVVYGSWVTRREARRSARSALTIDLRRRFELDLPSYDPSLSGSLKLQWLGAALDSFVCPTLSLQLSGYQDYEDPLARTPPSRGGPSRPRIDFTNFRVLTVGTANNDRNAFDIPIGRANDDRSIYLNIVRLKANSDARFLLFGTKICPGEPIGASLASGYLRQVDVSATGLLADVQQSASLDET